MKPESTGASTLKLSHFAPEAKSWVVSAQALADQKGHATIEPLHALASGLAEEPGVSRVFRASGLEPNSLRRRTDSALEGLPRGNEPAYLSEAGLELLQRASRVAKTHGSKTVRGQDLLLALAQEVRGAVGEIWASLSVEPAAVAKHLEAFGQGAPGSPGEGLRDLVSEARAGRLDPVIGRVREVRRLLAVLERRTKNHPVLVGEHGVGKSSIVGALAQRIARGDVPTRLLDARLIEVDAAQLVAGARLRSEVDSRVKKLLGTSIDRAEVVLVVRGVEALAGSGPQGAVLTELLGPGSTARVLATTTPEGWTKLQSEHPAVARRFSVLPVEEPSDEQVLEMVRGGALRIEEHHDVQISESAVVAAAELSRRYLRERFLPEAAFDVLDEAAAQKRLGTDGIPLEIDEKASRLDSLEAQIATLRGADDSASNAVRLGLDAEASELRPEVDTARRSVDERRSAVALLRKLRAEHTEALAELESARESKNFSRVGELEHGVLPELEKKIEAADQNARESGFVDEPRVVDDGDVARVIADFTGVPVTKMMEDEAERLGSLEQRLGQRVVGQDHAVSALSRAVRRGRVGLRDTGKPIGSFLFLGPSGVGKTELAKALAEALFDDEAALTRLDMSEFMEKHMVARLLGSPPGYVDSEAGGFLTEAVRQRPYSVLLFDEVEKAHQDVFNLLLQVLDDGRLTDGRGRLADFSNTVILMTSNIGSERILEADAEAFETEGGQELLRDMLSDSLREFFRPEMLNRLDDTLVFRPLGKPLLRLILNKEIRSLEKMLSDRRLTLEVDDAAADELVEQGYEPALGARPLKRALVRNVQDPLAEALVAGRLPEGGKVRVVLGDAGIEVEAG